MNMQSKFQNLSFPKGIMRDKLKIENDLQHEINKYTIYFNQKEDKEELTMKWKLCSKQALQEFKKQGFQMRDICKHLGVDINEFGSYDEDSDEFID